jgi:hypothetical protein
MERYLKGLSEEEKELYFKNLIEEKEKLSQSNPTPEKQSEQTKTFGKINQGDVKSSEEAVS